jgi:hypothetical protein
MAPAFENDPCLRGPAQTLNKQAASLALPLSSHATSANDEPSKVSICPDSTNVYRICGRQEQPLP